MEVSSYPGYLPDTSSSVDDDSEYDCPICIEKLEENRDGNVNGNGNGNGNRNIKKLACNHLFHENCINRWIEINSKCPLCLRPVINDNDNDNKKEIPGRNHRNHRNYHNYRPNVDVVIVIPNPEIEVENFNRRTCEMGFDLLFLIILVVILILSLLYMFDITDINNVIGNFTVNVSETNTTSYHTKHKYQTNDTLLLIIGMALCYTGMAFSLIRQCLVDKKPYFINCSFSAIILIIIVLSIITKEFQLRRIQEEESPSAQLENKLLNHYFNIKIALPCMIFVNILLNIMGHICKI